MLIMNLKQQLKLRKANKAQMYFGLAMVLYKNITNRSQYDSASSEHQGS